MRLVPPGHPTKVSQTAWHASITDAIFSLSATVPAAHKLHSLSGASARRRVVTQDVTPSISMPVQFPQFPFGGTMVDVVAPYPGMEHNPDLRKEGVHEG